MSKTARILGTLTLVGTALGTALALAPSPAAAQTPQPLQFNSLTPCRVFDTRVVDAQDGTNGQPFRNPGPIGKRIQGQCGITTARAVTLNVTITQPSHAGDLRIYPSDVAQPTVSTLNFNAGEPALANGAIVPLAQTPAGQNDLNFVIGMVVAPNVGSVHVLVDVTGYFNP